MARRCSAEEQVELPEEAGKRRDACKAEHRNRECHGEARVLLRKPAQGGERFFAVVPDDAEDEEGEVVRYRVHEQVVDDGRLCRGCGPEEGHHDVACLGDGTVGHEPAEPALLECAEVADEERCAGKERDERGNLFLDGGEGAEHENHEERDGGRLRCHGKDCGDGSRCAFVDIGCPCVEREQRELESDSAEEEQHGDPKERAGACRDGLLDFAEVQRTRETVEVAEAE